MENRRTLCQQHSPSRFLFFFFWHMKGQEPPNSSEMRKVWSNMCLHCEKGKSVCVCVWHSEQVNHKYKNFLPVTFLRTYKSIFGCHDFMEMPLWTIKLFIKVINTGQNRQVTLKFALKIKVRILPSWYGSAHLYKDKSRKKGPYTQHKKIAIKRQAKLLNFTSFSECNHTSNRDHTQKLLLQHIKYDDRQCHTDSVLGDRDLVDIGQHTSYS